MPVKYTKLGHYRNRFGHYKSARKQFVKGRFTQVRRGRKRNIMVNVPKSIRGFPPSTECTLSYSDICSFTSTGAYVMIHGNSIYDPIYTSTGTTSMLNEQPSYRDTYATLYSRYRVLSSTLTVSYCASQTPFSALVVYPTDISDVPANPPTEARNVQGAKYRLVPNAMYEAKTIKTSCTTAWINGISNAQMLDDLSYSALQAASPTDSWYWIIHSAATDGITVQNILYTFNITYRVLFTDPIPDRTND